MTIGASWFGTLFSTWLSRCPRGMKTAPGIMPCSNSSSSRTSRNVVSPTNGSASAGEISRISDFVCFNRSRKLAITTPRDAQDSGSDTGKSYRGSRIFPTSDQADQHGQGLTELVADDGVGDRVERRLLGVQDDEPGPVA